MKLMTTIFIFLISTLVLAGFANNNLYAKPYESGISGTKHTYTCPVNGANDFHITYAWVGPMRLVEHYDANFPNFQAIPTTPDSSVWQCTWWGTTYNQGETAQLGARFYQEFYENAIICREIGWTQNGVPVGPVTPGTGYQVTPPHGIVPNLVYYVKNHSGAPLTVKSLQFKFTQSEPDLAAASYPMSGFDSPRSDIALADGDSFAVTLPAPAYPPPYYLLAQGIINQGSVDVGNFIHLHEHPLSNIPTLSGWGILVVVLLLLAAGSVAVRRRRRGVSV